MRQFDVRSRNLHVYAIRVAILRHSCTWLATTQYTMHTYYKYISVLLASWPHLSTRRSDVSKTPTKSCTFIGKKKYEAQWHGIHSRRMWICISFGNSMASACNGCDCVCISPGRPAKTDIQIFRTKQILLRIQIFNQSLRYKKKNIFEEYLQTQAKPRMIRRNKKKKQQQFGGKWNKR